LKVVVRQSSRGLPVNCAPYVAHMEILEVDGEKVLFDVKTQPKR
jgi:hypothetical protein